jgi:hypothetical protein
MSFSLILTSIVMIFYLKFYKIMLYQFTLVIMSYDFVWNIQILNFKNGETWKNILKVHMISTKKVMNIKVIELINI